jgi:DNA-binding transcriptional MerR regulator
MFQIGEFSRIARISTRQLRHYDDLGLFKPSRIDTETGYRYYSASQLPQLNRILALKDLGLTLDQIAHLLTNDLSPEELYGMLTLKKAQIEQTLNDELTRVRNIEERIWQIETEGVLSDEDVVLKSFPEQKFLSIRQVMPTIRDGFRRMYELHRLLPQRAGRSLFGNFGLIFHSEGFETKDLDVEMGFLMKEEQDVLGTLRLADGQRMTTRTIPAVETMATLARVGIYNDSVGHYGALGTWIERHDYDIAGPGWEVFLQPFIPGQEHEAVIEIQIPVKPHKYNIIKVN